MDISDIKGLTTAEVAAKRKQFGYNELPDREKKSWLKIILGIATEPMIFLLIAVVVVYFLLGDRTEAIILMVSVFGIFGINLAQEMKTEKALEALRDLASPSCGVIRDGEHVTIPSRELVPGDMVIVSEGSRVPADGALVLLQNLAADESLLTGESVSVEKKLTDDNNKVFSGSVVVKGHGVAEVTTIGVETEVGKIGSSLNTIETEETILNKEIDSAVKKIAIGAVAAALFLTVVFWLTRGSLLNGFLAGLTLSIAILPEEFPVVLTVFMALGAWRMARHNVLTRRSTAIETLGAASVLCTDKTGTLTENRMTVADVVDMNGNALQVGDKMYDHIISYGVLSSQINPFDPMEEAFINKANELMGSTEGIYNSLDIVKEYPLDSESLSVVHVWGGDDDKPVTVALKGAPEAVVKLCRLPSDESKRVQGYVSEFAKKGLRVLAVASGKATENLPEKREGFEYDFLGLVALADPIRPEAASAVKMCHDAGVRVIMVTGDYPETAQRIGGEVGLDNTRVVTGAEFEAMSDEEKLEVIKTVSIFSRVLPAHKLTIVETLKNEGEVVAMTGDGVNDAPALKSAHIGIAMGKRGTDVAREAAAIVLLDDDFTSIVGGIRLGRRIFANLQKAIAYILTVHIPIIILSLVPVLLGWPLVLLPIHIVFLEFIIDPSCTLVFESEREAPNTMKKPPRNLSSPLFGKRMVLGSLVEGLFMSAVVLVIHYLTMSSGWAEDKTRAMTFLLIALMNLSLIVVLSGRQAWSDALKSGVKSPMLLVLAIAGVALTVIYAIPPVTDLFKFDSLSVIELTAGITIALVTALSIIPIRKILEAR